MVKAININIYDREANESPIMIATKFITFADGLTSTADVKAAIRSAIKLLAPGPNGTDKIYVEGNEVTEDSFNFTDAKNVSYSFIRTITPLKAPHAPRSHAPSSLNQKLAIGRQKTEAQIQKEAEITAKKQAFEAKRKKAKV